MYGKNTNNIKRVCCSFWLNLFTQFFFINSKTLCRNVSFETGERQFMSMAKFWHGSLERFHIFPFRLAQFSVLRTLAITEIGHLRFVVNSHTAAAPRPTRSLANSLTGQLAHGPTRPHQHVNAWKLFKDYVYMLSLQILICILFLNLYLQLV